MVEMQIQILKGFRKSLLKMIEGLTAAQLNYTPAGFNNNVIWNMGHMMAAQQNMTYKKAGLPLPLPDSLVAPFLSGTKSDYTFSAADIELLKSQFISSLDQLQKDIPLFTSFSPSPLIEKAYGFQVNTIADALDYLLYHDGMHAGRIIAFVKGGLLNERPISVAE